MSRRRRTKTHENLICCRASNNSEDQEKYKHEIPYSPSELNYKGQVLKVNTAEINILRIITDDEYGPLFITNMNGQSNNPIAIKRFVLEIEPDALVCPVDLATLESLTSKNCSYILDYYGAVINRDAFSLCVFLEPMDASMEHFSKAVHSLDTPPNMVEWKDLLCRLINNVASALHFLTMNGIKECTVNPLTILVNRQACFKLCDIGISREIRHVAMYLESQMSHYKLSVAGLKYQGYTIHPDMWMFGLTLLEILTGERTFDGMTAFQLFSSIGKWTPTFPYNLTDLEEIQPLIIRLLKFDSQQQPQNYVEILEIPFISAVNEQASEATLDFLARILDKIPSGVD